MSAVNEAMGQHLTLGAVANHCGFDLVPPQAGNVTVTSLADKPGDVKPGALYIPRTGYSEADLVLAEQRGAYGVLLPPEDRTELTVPRLNAKPSAAQIGNIASDIAGSPSSILAVFAICGDDPDETQAQVVRLADFLHDLGNPVGVLSAAGSSSLERTLNMEYPLSILGVQHMLSVCLEDSATAVVISADAQTLAADALQGVSVDVLGTGLKLVDVTPRELVSAVCARYGFSVGEGFKLTQVGEEASWMASQAPTSSGVDSLRSRRRLALAIAMALSAGVRRGNIRSALRVAQEMR